MSSVIRAPVVAAPARAAVAVATIRATIPRIAALPARRWVSARPWKTARRQNCVRLARWQTPARFARLRAATPREAIIVPRVGIIAPRAMTAARLAPIMAHRVVMPGRRVATMAAPQVARKAAHRVASARSAPARSAPAERSPKANEQRRLMRRGCATALSCDARKSGSRPCVRQANARHKPHSHELPLEVAFCSL